MRDFIPSFVSGIDTNFYAIIISTVSLLVSIYNAISPNLSKIKVSIRFKGGLKCFSLGLYPSCDISVCNFSKQTKYIQKVYIKYIDEDGYGTIYTITEDIFSIEPQQVIKIPIPRRENKFHRVKNCKANVYAIAIDSLGKKWISQNFITFEQLCT